MDLFQPGFRFAQSVGAAALVWIGSSGPALAQSALQYSIVQDQFGNTVGEISGNGISVDLDVYTQPVSVATRDDVEVTMTLCADQTTRISPETCPTTAPAVSVTGFEGTDTAVAPNGAIFLVGKPRPSEPNGYVYSIQPSKSLRYPGAATRVAASADSNPWVVNAGGQIFRWTGSTWQQLPGAARDIGGNRSGAMWVIGTDGIPYRWNPAVNNWQQVAGSSATAIAVAPDGNAWIVNASNAILRWNGSGWQQLPGAAKDVSVGDDGTAYVVGLDDQVYRMPPGATNWTGTGLTARRVGAAGTLVARVIPPPPPPAAPGSLRTASVTSTSLLLMWTGRAGSTSYTVKRATASAGPYSVVGSTMNNSLDVTGLSAGATYYFAVAASNDAGSSADSPPLQVTMPSARKWNY